MLYLLGLAGGLFVFSLSWPSLLGCWVSMEAANLIILTGFFSYSSAVNRYVGLMGAVLVSGLSSGALFVGFLSEEFSWLVFIALCLKVGMFPFINWVVIVLMNSPWLVFYFLASFSKVSLLYFSFILDFAVSALGDSLFVVTFLILILFLLERLSGLKMLLTLSSVSTGALLMLSLGSLGVFSSTLLLVAYFPFSAAFVYVLSKLEVGPLDGPSATMVSFVLLSTPFSLAVLYKLVGSWLACHFSFVIVFMWVVFSCIEFVLLVLWLFEKSSVNEIW
nr:NADH dehydrogenase subunit 2 [Cichlidogyrus cirratus]